MRNAKRHTKITLFPLSSITNMRYLVQKWIVIQCLEVLTKKNRDEILFILGFMTLSIIFANEDIQKAL